MGGDMWAVALSTFVTLLLRMPSRAEVLEPPEFNLATGRNITATATCGLEEDKTVIIEQYCLIGGASSDLDISAYINNGQHCYECNKGDPKKWHPASNAIDGTNKWWMSPPLSRGMEYNQVNLTIDFGREFQVAYVTIRMGNSPRPGIWVLEKSTDYGKTYEPWQYFADSELNCMKHFGVKESVIPTADDTVLCVTDFSKAVPLSDGEIIVPLLKDRPSAKNFSNSATLQKWTKATNVRLNLIHTKTLLGHLMSVVDGDPSVSRRYFYSIKDISIGGKCNCNGHAEECGEFDPDGGNKLWCKCKHNTDGINCERCRDGFVQKLWKPSKIYEPFKCEPCNCFGHSDKCEYNATVDQKKLSIDINGKYEGGGVCKHCKHNTEGINCQKCKPGFYRPYGRPLNATDTCAKCRCDKKHSSGSCRDGDGMCECRPEYKPPFCQSCSHGHYGFPNCRPCECNEEWTEGDHCNTEGGQCICKKNYIGRLCDQCADGYYNFPYCLPCQCNLKGAVNNKCDQKTGNCKCEKPFGGKLCDKCMDGYYKFPKCTKCNCNKEGTTNEICDKETGSCYCRTEHGGKMCEKCVAGRYSFPKCISCDCSPHGRKSIDCSHSGKCECHPNYTGRKCDQCNAGYYQYPDCLDCKCNTSGSKSKSCDEDGKCTCYSNFTGTHCDRCKQGHFNFPVCEVCNCDPRGVKDSEADCELQPSGELCPCKKNVIGHICDECKPRFWNIQKSNPDGCQDCECNLPGVIGGIGECNSLTGQCFCKIYVDTPKCKECKNGTFNLLNENVFGCSDCECDVGGSLNNTCDKKYGQCFCRPNIEGRTCSEPVDGYYFPTLHNLKFEAEDARRHDHSTVHFHFDDNIFPNSSGRGYAIFSKVQREILLEVNIKKPSNYHMILHYVNLNDKSVDGIVEMAPGKGVGSTEMFKALLKPTRRPSFVTVTGITTVDPSMVLDPGNWTMKIMSENGILLDYIVLLPSEFYEASILTKRVSTPCFLEQNNKEKHTFCRHMEYLDISHFDKAEAKEKKVKKPAFSWKRGTAESKSEEDKQDWNLQITSSSSDKYVLLVIYRNLLQDGEIVSLTIESTSQGGTDKGNVAIYPCNFTTPCRQAVQDSQGSVKVFVFKKDVIKLKVEEDDKHKIEIKTVAAIPYDQWSFDYVRPKSVCVKMDGKCMPTTFPHTLNSKTFEFESSKKNKKAYNFPKEVYNKNLGLIYLDQKDEVVKVKGKVSAKRSYVLIVHYYQPHYSGFSLDVMIHNGRIHQAYLDTLYCPSAFGCRSVIHEANGNIFFNITDEFKIEFKKNEPKTIWFDYIRVIPHNLYKDNILEEENIDLTALFIGECGKNEFHINTDSEGFCKKSVFSIASHYENGTLPCECNEKGSLSPICKKFGGQCFCKSKIIGRQCDQCKTGYYKFPNCIPCKCPNKLPCNTTTGVCLCPPTVTGEQCDQCDDYSYAFDEKSGCKDCGCNSEGVENGNLKCDQITGECSCKKNVEGRTCNRCSSGYSNFPSCKPCKCDVRGTKPGICDEVSSECICKKNVIGEQCEKCKEGTFNIDADNPDGCTNCYCFGKTKKCTSSNLYRAQVSQMQGWKLVEVKVKEKWFSYELSVRNISIVPSESDNAIHADLTSKEVAKKIVYFTAPNIYLRNKLTSYGGFLNYSITHSPQDTSERVDKEADVIFHGLDTLIYPLKKLLEPEKVHQISVNLAEGNLKLLNGSIATREKILEVFKDLKGLYIRASYSWPSSFAKLSEVIMETANDVHLTEAPKAFAVEQCSCPSNYKGLSCETCAPGYFRSESEDCIPCQCNDHADECDPLTGACIGCKHNTIGDHCEKCKKGYYGDPTSGKSGACIQCTCPLTVESNNFAEDCQLKSDGRSIKCNCLTQYKGDQCEICAPGYYGDPKKIGNKCKPCECSGNINLDDHNSCDPQTGKCLKCLNNTSGYDCSKCAEGYYGDAVILKNCKRCECNTCGTSSCDRKKGYCECKDYVVGDLCDQCAPYHWNFNGCEGCTPCNCQLASKSMQCDLETGQCKCQPGVIGLKCDKCDAGYWNYSSKGCTDCGCHEKYSHGSKCDPYTGKCVCKSGLIGDKCDHCPSRYVLVPGQGCLECDMCVHILLNETDYLYEMSNNIKWELKNHENSQLINKKLNYINDSITLLQDKVKFLNFDSMQLTEDVEALQDKSRKFYHAATSLLQSSFGLKKKGMDFLLEVWWTKMKIDKDIEEAKNIMEDIVAYNDAIVDGFPTDLALPDALKFLKEIQDMNFKPYEKNFLLVLESAQEFLNKAQGMSDSVLKRTIRFTAIHNRIAVIEDKSNDLIDHATYSKENMNMINLYAVKNRLNQIIKGIEHSKNNITATKVYLTEANDYLRNATEIWTNMDSINSTLIEYIKKLVALKDQLESLIDSGELKEVKGYVEMAEAHANNLTKWAQEIKGVFAYTRNTSANAVRAANAYKNIVNAILEAKDAANAADEAATRALKTPKDILEQIEKSRERSLKANFDARDNLHKAQVSLKQYLTNIQKDLQLIRSLNEKSENILKEIYSSLEEIKHEQGTWMELIKSVNLSAEESSRISKNTLSHISDIARNAPGSLKEVQNISKIFHDAKVNLSLAGNEVKKLKSILPELSEAENMTDRMQSRHKAQLKKIENEMVKLKNSISKAIDEISRISVGVKMFDNSTIMLRNPKGLIKIGTSGNISMYFQTKERNGLLFYLGNEVGTKYKLKRFSSDDFVALEIENGYPTLKIDLGSGTETITSEKYVADGLWYQIIIERTGNIVQLLTCENISHRQICHRKKKVLKGISSVLDLDQDLSKIFVGGYPNVYAMQSEVKNSGFVGGIEEFLIDNTPVSLWSFREAQNIYGIHERDTKEEKDNIEVEKAMKFDGTGYVTFKGNANQIKKQFTIIFNFKTTTKDGLLFLVKNSHSFLSIELTNGTILYQFDLGNGMAILDSNATYNDGKWHSVEAGRQGNKAILKVDNVEKAYGSSPGNATFLITTELMYFGGFPQKHNFKHVSNKAFVGCIQDVQIESKNLQWFSYSEAYGVSYGCPEKVDNVASFRENSKDFIRLPNITAANYLQLTFKFNTSQENGLLFYATDTSQWNTVSLSMTNGSLALYSPRGRFRVLSGRKKPQRFNDGQWHAVSATLDRNVLTLNIDDYYAYKSKNMPMNLAIENGNVYFGGVPEGYDINSNNVPHQDYFIGCIGDVTVNDNVVKFQEMAVNSFAAIGKCNTKRYSDDQYPFDEHHALMYHQGKHSFHTKTNCSLPLIPRIYEDENVINSYRYGTQRYSYAEYSVDSIRIKHNISIEFKTNNDGVIFYTASGKNSLALFLKNGKLNYAFSCNDEIELLSTKQNLNDAQWHSVAFSRHGSLAKLFVDNDLVTVKSTSCKNLKITDSFFIGGISSRFETDAQKSLKVPSSSFYGCIRNIVFSGHRMDQPTVLQGVIPCSDSVEYGAFFTIDAGYIRLAENFDIGRTIVIEMSIKPRKSEGLLLSVHGKRDFLVLQMNQGKVMFTVGFGRSSISTEYEPSERNLLCNGRWHNITATKNKNIMILDVDGHQTMKIIYEGTTDAQTSNPLFLGGHADIGSSLKGVQTQESFVGCISGLSINSKRIHLDDKKSVGEIILGVCPTS